MKDIDGETYNDDWGVISGMSGAGHPGEDAPYYSDTCKLYKIDSDIEAESCDSFGGAINYMNRLYMSELKINCVKSRVACEEIGSLSGGIGGYIYPTGVPNCVIENFEVEMDGGSWGSEVGGVYGYASGNSATINVKNGKVTVNNANTSSMCGAIIGGTFGYSVSISNVNAYGKMNGSDETGGIIGYASFSSQQTLNIEDVNNYIDVSCRGDYVGGIIGYASNCDMTIKNVNNYGKIYGTYYVGGIAGYIGSGTRLKLYNCVNKGELGGEGTYQGVGGLIGYSPTNSIIIRDSYNVADIKIDTTINRNSCYYVGGLVGYCGTYSGESNTEIQNCYNKGKITVLNADSSYEIGGLIGQAYGNYLLQDCYNEGDIDIKQTRYGYTVGGIIGNGYSMTGQINKVINKGKIYIENKEDDGGTTSNIGGIAGSQGTAVINNAINQGDIEIISQKTEYRDIGGITGQNKSSVYNAYNSGNITLLGGVYAYTDNRGIGGIAGSNYVEGGTARISNCYNTGKILGMTKAGGIAGHNQGTIEDCYNEGKVTAYREEAGGIVALNNGSISNVYNVGNVFAKNSDVKIGPIVGISTDGYNWNGDLISVADITKAYYSDKVMVQGENANEIGIKQQDNYMRTTDFYNTLNENNVWTYVDKQYPKLLISAGEKIPEAVELNIVNEHKVYTISTALNNPARGTITGSNQEYIEEVRHGNNNTKEIEMIPKPGYIVGKVTINGKQQEIVLNDDGSYQILAGQLENIKEDILVYVEFMKQDQIVTITKVDKDIEGATFDIVQTESGSIDNAISELKESEIENVYGADLNSTVDEAIGNPDMTKGSFTRIDNGFSLTSVFDYRSGNRYYYSVIAKVPIDLTNHTGEYIVGFETYTTIWDNCAVYNSENQTIGRIDMTGNLLP